MIVRHPHPGPPPAGEGGSPGVTAPSQTGPDRLRLAGTAVYRGLTGMAHAWLAETPFVVVDLETTGGSAVYDRVLEVAAIRVQNGVIQDRLERLVEPGVPIPPFVTPLTGINAAMV